MIIKKLLLAYFLLFLSSIGFSQMKWSVQAGLNYSHIITRDRNDVKAVSSSVSGMSWELEAAIPLVKRLGMAPTLRFVRRGFHQEETSQIGWGKNFKAKTSYIELPIDLFYSINAGPGNLLLAAGPYIGYGTGGKWTTEGSVTIGDIRIDNKGDIAFQNDVSYGGYRTYSYARPWDYGAHFRVGYILFDHYSLSAHLQQGIANLTPRFGDYKLPGSIKNKSWGLSVGYRF